jgi:multiple sugar transport system permease protein
MASIVSQKGLSLATEQVKRKEKVNIAGLLIYVILAASAIFWILPFLWMFSTSLRLPAESYRLPPAWLPTDWRFENYIAVFKSSVPIVRLLFNSLYITLIITVGQLFTCSLAGYAFACLRFPGRDILFILLLTSLMVPGQVTIIPVFIIMRLLGLVDNHASLILPGLTSAFGVFLMRQFFLTLPRDLIDAAKIDGAGTFTTFFRVALPQAGPSLATLGILTANDSWNNYFQPLIFINTWEKMTLPLGITALRGFMASGNPSIVMAAVTLAILPVLLIYLLAQRWIVAGMMQSGIKG